MPISGRSPARRAGQVATGLGALAVLIGLLVGAPVALATLAGNPLPDHVPGLNELTTVLTSRDDGQLFLRALAIVGWAGWATFALSVLVELPARALRRPAVRLPGLGRQQRVAAALVGSVALVLAVSPAASAATILAQPAAATAPGTLIAVGGPHAGPVSVSDPDAATASGPAPSWLAGPLTGPEEPRLGTDTGPQPGTDAPQWGTDAPPSGPGVPEPVYRVERDDYLGHIADRYLGDFDRYPELARLNKIRDADRIRPGQLLHLPDDASDHGVRTHATGLVAIPSPPGGWPHTAPDEAAPPDSVPSEVAPSATDGASAADGHGEKTTRVTFGTSSADAVNDLNRPLAVSAVIAAAGIVGAQVGAVLGLRRRSPAAARAEESGRHRLRGR